MRRGFLALAVLAGCGGAGQFVMSSDDNNAAALSQAFAIERKPAAGKPMNAAGKPMAFLVAAGAKRQLIAWDLAAGKADWTVDSDVSSRVAVGASLVAHREGKTNIVARSIADGHKLWSASLGGKETFLGLAADGDRVFYVVRDDSGKRTWRLVALQGGREVWRADAPGVLGAPAARGGLVYMPFMQQWLSILDAASGKQIARILQKDEAINFVRTTSDGVYYGSQGVFLLDERSVAGTRQGARYVTAQLPEFVRSFYYYDAFQPVQAEYSAFDRNRILWRVKPEGDGLAFRDGMVVVFTYRFFFAFDAKTGTLRWAHNHPRFDVVAAEDLGSAILYVSQEGELGALDPATGARSATVKVGSRILGATFDADGWKPAGEGEPPITRETLASIVTDRDARFNSQKLFAVQVLGTLPGNEVTASLLDILRDDATPKAVYDKAAQVLVARKDPEALPLLTAALKVKEDYIKGTHPRAVDVIARALGAIGRPDAASALLEHFRAPSTPVAAVRDIAAALGACGNKEAVPELRAFLLMYRADPAFATDTGPLSETIDALLALGSSAERELVAFVADEPRTLPRVAEYARRALAQTAGPVREGGK